MSKRAAIALAAVAVVGLGCLEMESGGCLPSGGFHVVDPLPDPPCYPFPGRPAIFVLLVDSLSHEPIDDGNWGVVSDGAYLDTMYVDPNGKLTGAPGRSGIYEVTVGARGYRKWTVRDIDVGRDECENVVTRFLRADLVRDESHPRAFE